MRNAVHIPQFQQPFHSAADPARTAQRSGIGSPTHWTHEIITRDGIAGVALRTDGKMMRKAPQPGSGHELATII